MGGLAIWLGCEVPRDQHYKVTTLATESSQRGGTAAQNDNRCGCTGAWDVHILCYA